jgi:asparagine N-glycosylation enzyme membrane subunit Stt3
MDVLSVVLTVGEIALGLAGFSAVLVALSGQPSRWSALDSFRISGMLGASLTALLLSLLPAVVRFLGVLPSVAWRASAGIAAIVLIASAAIAARLFWRLPPTDRTTVRPTLFWSIQTTMSAVAAALAAAATGLLGHAEGVYLLGLYCLLVIASYVIVRFLFARPGG